MRRSPAIADGGDRAYRLAVHTDNAAGFVDGNGIERGCEPRFLRANGHASPAANAGVPVDDEDEGVSFWHNSKFF
jgi:hypothetical protein